MLGLLPEDVTWTELGRYRRKALLSPKELMWLINDVKISTRGGEAMSSRELKDKLQTYIFNVHSKNRTIHLLPTLIPERTLDSLVSTIKSQCVFDIFDTVSNKTESRAIAEWSLRSMLAYTMIVTCNHFLPNVDPTYYHTKK